MEISGKTAWRVQRD